MCPDKKSESIELVLTIGFLKILPTFGYVEGSGSLNSLMVYIKLDNAFGVIEEGLILLVTM